MHFIEYLGAPSHQLTIVAGRRRRRGQWHRLMLQAGKPLHPDTVTAYDVDKRQLENRALHTREKEEVSRPIVLTPEMI